MGVYPFHIMSYRLHGYFSIPTIQFFFGRYLLAPRWWKWFVVGKLLLSFLFLKHLIFEGNLLPNILTIITWSKYQKHIENQVHFTGSQPWSCYHRQWGPDQSADQHTLPLTTVSVCELFKRQCFNVSYQSAEAQVYCSSLQIQWWVISFNLVAW